MAQTRLSRDGVITNVFYFCERGQSTSDKEKTIEMILEEYEKD